ncbi:phage tail protein [Occallatibacter riparius]|uniref:Phage tail protein n=1 Tax=Occallatibacter riparius TaxID=1002689 RepID=A0A9J7BQ39_9BACT|nr:phage tail protein [Occallatibacter riparius]UWZ84665.1 phage tail protein [Occallatibacter riparius]
MAKAVTEVAIGAAAIGASFIIPGSGIALLGMTLSHAAVTSALVSMGASQIMAGLADALRTNKSGIAVAVTTPIGPWAYGYGRQKVGGVEIFRESNNNTGVSGSTSNNKQLHRVYALFCHPSKIGSFQLRIDGKQVLLTPSGSDWVSFSPTQAVRNITSISRTAGVVTMHLDGGGIIGADGTTLQIRSAPDNTLNGTFLVTQPNPADATVLTYICGGPDIASTSGGSARTTFSDYKDKIRVSFLDGNHTSTFPTLLAAGTSWKASDLCLGHTLVYVQMGYDDGVFPSSIPNVSFVLDAKNDILDPRTGLRGWTDNAALCIADMMCLPKKRGGFGMTIGTDIPTAQLIAAANLCDETVALAAGGTIRRYRCNTFFQLSDARGTVLKDMLSSCAGRVSYQGGQYSIFPAGWVTPTLDLTDADLAGPIRFRPRLSISDTANAIKGTYVSPENAYQLADVPAYAMDAKHGFVSDPYLAEDGGERIYKDAHFPCTDDSATAQRLAKIALMRLRNGQGRMTLTCKMSSYRAVACDVITLTHPRYTYLRKPFEVLASRVVFKQMKGGAVRPHVELDVTETDSSSFDWNASTEQLTPQGYQQPQNVGVRLCAPPEDVTAYSGPGAVIDGITYPSTFTTGADGRVQNSIYVRWLQPNDANVVSGGHLEVQWQPLAAVTWSGLAKVDPSNDHIFIPNVTDGAQYNIQVRAVNCAGVPSDWIAVGPITVSNGYSASATSGSPVAPPGTLSAQGLADGTANITVLPFTPTIGTPACTPSPTILTGLNQSQLYHVYYVDATFSGGTITPIATQNPADYLNKVGYFLIGDIVTPSYTPRYQPSTFSDLGNSTTSNPVAAYDNDVTSEAIVSSNWWTTGSPGSFVGHVSSGQCQWAGFPSVSPAGATTLHVIASFDGGGSSGTTISGSIDVKIGGTVTNLVSFSAVTAEADYTMTIPAGTDLSTISVSGSATAGAGTLPGSGGCALKGFEIYIQ